MRKRFHIVAAVLVVATVGGATWLGLRTPEPSYKGKGLGFWVEEAFCPRTVSGDEAQEAIRHIGTNGIPQLLKMVAARDSALKRRALALAEKQNLIPIRLRDAQSTRNLTYSALMVLGPDARPAVPTLIDLLGDKDQTVQFSAAIALSHIGTSASNAVPAMIKRLQNTNSPVIHPYFWNACIQVISPGTPAPFSLGSFSR